MKIVIVEDNPDDRLLLKTNLEARDCDVVEAADGIEGLALARKHKPVLIISDALMPHMDGFQFLRRVRQDEELKTTPFVFYSATYTGEEEVKLALSLGANAYIFKPKEADELWSELRKVLDACELKKSMGFRETIQREDEYLQRYTDIVATKLEEKIKELEKTRDCVEESRKQYKKLFEASLDGIYRTDEKNRFVQLNNAFARMFGYDRAEDMIGMTSLDFWADMSERDTYVRELMTKKGLSAYPVHARKKDGSDLHLEISSTVLEDEHGRCIGIEGIARDMTEHEKLESRLRQAQKMEAIGQLAGGVAHDFNNILSAIIGYGHLSLMKLPENDPVKHYVEQVLLSAERATALTQSLLTFSRKQPVKMELLALGALIGKFEKFLLRLLREDIEMKTRYADEELTIMADRGQIEQVVMNLVTNARDAMPTKGTLTIETKPATLDKSFVSAHGYGRVGEYAMLSVSDTGIGMNEETKQRIFEPFFTTKDVGKGTGLGLATVYGIVKAHDGFINVYSEPGRGTAFHIYIPRVRAEAGAPEPVAQAPVPLKGGSETILLAEDDAGLRKMTSTVLRHMGYSVIEAENGQAAVEKFIENKEVIRLVILDGIMPKMNGKEAYHEIVSLAPQVRCIFMSGYAEDVFTKDGILQADVEFIAKPVTPSQLLHTVREVLDR